MHRTARGEVGTPDIETPPAHVDRQGANLRFCGPTLVVPFGTEKRSLGKLGQGIWILRWFSV